MTFTILVLTFVVGLLLGDKDVWQTSCPPARFWLALVLAGIVLIELMKTAS